MREIRLTILGEPVSKANSRRIVVHNGKPKVIKSADALAYEQSIQLQVKPLAQPLTGEVQVRADCYYASHRKDLDASLLLDGLQGRIFKNDRQVRSQVFEHHIDKKNPRAEVLVRPRPLGAKAI